MTDDRIIAFGLLTQRDLQTLGPSFSRAWPVDEQPCFTQLLSAIDEADHEFRNSNGRPLGGDAPPGNGHGSPIGAGRR